MTSVLIVEDDVMYRYALKTIIDWEKTEFYIQAEAINGKDALRIIKNKIPDIVITDISMPEMNGIELIKYLKKKYPSIKIIVLSSYDDFEFVREALLLGAEDYVLKYDLNENELTKLLNKARKKIIKDKEKSLEIEFIENNLDAIENSLLNEIIKGKINDVANIKNKLSFLGKNGKFNNLIMMSIEIENFDFSIDIRNLFKKEIKKILVDYILGLIDNKYNIILDFMDVKSENKIYNEVNLLGQNILYSINKNYNKNVNIGISNKFNDIKNANMYYNQCIYALQNKIYEGNNKLFFYSKKCNNKNRYKYEYDKLLETLYLNIKNDDEKVLKYEISKFFNEIYKQRLSQVELKKALFELYFTANTLANKLQIDFSDLADKNTKHFLSLDNIADIENERKYFLDLFHEILRRKNKNGKYNKSVQQVITYINSNYNKDISVEHLANMLELTPNYLCSLFKNETGFKITEYINNIRIEEAKRLLKSTNMKVYEISEKVGFNNVSYFCTLFKKNCGVKIKEFRNLKVC